MAISKKLQEVFDWYVGEFSGDFFSFIKILDGKLKVLGLTTPSATFIANVLDELDLGKERSTWKPFPSNENIVSFLESLPPRFIKDWWGVIAKYVPEERWKQFRQKLKQAKSAYVNSLSSDPIILVNENKHKDLIFSVHFGNITSKLGLSEGELKLRYDDVYDAIEEELGYTAIKAHLPEHISVIDWPNASTLEDAKYEFIVKAHVDPAIGDIENSLVVALSKLGLK